MAKSSAAHTPALDPSRMTDAELEQATSPNKADATAPGALEININELPELPDADPLTVDHDAADADPVTLDSNAQRQYEQDHQIVTIRIRRNLVRTKIGDTWYTFTKGEEREVPRWVADWLVEKGFL
jgi:hypothetical protein